MPLAEVRQETAQREGQEARAQLPSSPVTWLCPREHWTNCLVPRG